METEGNLSMNTQQEANTTEHGVLVNQMAKVHFNIQTVIFTLVTLNLVVVLVLVKWFITKMVVFTMVIGYLTNLVCFQFFLIFLFFFIFHSLKFYFNFLIYFFS